MPAAAHIALLPLLMFAFGSLLDLLRRKSPAPLLMASVLGFAAAAFISFYHYFMLDVVMNFDRSHFKLATLCLLALTAMPMLLAYARRLELSWQPARWLLVAVLTGCLIHLFLPGYTAALPRDMTLMYQEVADSGQGHVVLESIYQRHDRQFADKHDFVEVELNDGALGNVTRPARSVSPLDLPGVKVRRQEAAQDGQTTRRRVELELPSGSPLLWLTFPEDAGLEKAWVDDVLALDTGLKTKRARSLSALWIIHPPGEIIQVELELRSPDPLTAAVVTWHELPGILVAPFMGNWPDEARPFLFGPRAQKIQQITLPAATEAPTGPAEF
jgi:hypothetical protein